MSADSGKEKVFMKRELINKLLIIILIIGGVFVINNNRVGNKPVVNLCKDCNLIIIAYDALQARHVSHLGYSTETTPTIDKIAAGGVSFKNNISVAPWTVPSYMSMFTGLYPSEHKVVNKYVKYSEEEQVISNLSKLSPEVVTLAQVMKQNGYITGGFTGDAGVNSVFGYDQGFDEYFDENVFGSISDAGVEAIKWLNENKGKKFFLFLHGYDSHGQFQIADDYQGRFVDDKYGGKYDGTPKEQRDLREFGLDNGEIELSQEEVSFWRSWYDSKIRDADDRVAKIYEELNNMGLLNNTVILVVSDHGTEFYEHKTFDHGHTLYDELVNVPLVINAPGLPEGKIIDNQVSTVDIAPTLIEMLGLTVDEKYSQQMRGNSLLPLVLQDSQWDEDVFIETDYRNFTHKRGLRTSDGWKFVVSMESGKKELYNLNNDPQELINLIESNPEKAYELELKVMAHLEDMGTDPYGDWPNDCLPVYGDQCK